MDYMLRHLFRFDPKDFEDQLVKHRPEYRYLYYVGLGFCRKCKSIRLKRSAGSPAAWTRCISTWSTMATDSRLRSSIIGRIRRPGERWTG